MLAEKFCLLLEALRERDTELRVQSTSPHVPATLSAPAQQAAKTKRAA